MKNIEAVNDYKESAFWTQQVGSPLNSQQLWQYTQDMGKLKPDKILTWNGDLAINPTTSQVLLLVSEGGEGVSFLYEHGP